MRKILFMLFALAAMVGCQSEYDKMSEYEKAIYDVGTNCPLSLADVLKSAPVWERVKTISSTQPEGKGSVDVADYSKGDLDGGVNFAFGFGPKFECWSYAHVGPFMYAGYFLECDYSIQPDGDLILSLDGIAADRSYIRKVRVVAYNESSIVIDTYNASPNYPYVTFVLKPGTEEKREWLETKCNGLTKIE
jgi:hypothetical protein